MLFAYTGLFLWSFLAATVLPLGSEAPLVVLVRSERQVFLPVLASDIGQLPRGLHNLLARSQGRVGIRSKPGRRSEADFTGGETAASLWPAGMLLSWVPFIGDALIAVAGANKIPFARFSFWVLLGKALRCLAVAWAASSI